MTTTTLKKGDRFVAYPDERPCSRLYVEVTRVAKDGTWADIRVQTWAIMWTKRQPLRDGGLPETVREDWTDDVFGPQMEDHSDWLEERAVGR